MVKVCHMTSAHNQRDVRIFQKECVTLAKNGYEVYLVASGESCTVDGVHIVGFGEYAKKRWKRIIFSSLKTYQLAKDLNADIYQFHDPELLPYGYLLKRKGKKVVFDSHENLFLYIQEKEYLPFGIGKILGKIFSAFLKKICKKMDAIISVDPLICEEYKKINKNVVQLANFPVLEEILNNTFEEEKKGIAFAGGVEKNWNHIAVIEALGKVSQKIVYTICGPTDQRYMEQMQALPQWEQVDFKGRVPHKEALKVLKKSAIGVALCSYSNNTNQKRGTLGNTKLFEIMMTGIPVVCTRFELWEEIITGYGCGICIEDPKNSDEIANALEYLLKHKDQAREMGIQGQRAVKEKYNWGLEEPKLLGLYAKLSAR